MLAFGPWRWRVELGEAATTEDPSEVQTEGRRMRPSLTPHSCSLSCSFLLIPAHSRSLPLPAPGLACLEARAGGPA